MSAHITRFMERCFSLAKEAVVGQPAAPLQRGTGGFADWVIIAIHCLREREVETYRSVVDKLKVMGPIREVLGLQRAELPDPSTLCKAMDRLTMAVCRALLQRTLSLFDLGDVAAIDATGFDRVAASRRYARRTGYRFLAMKTTLVDCRTGAVLDVHCTTSRPHDTKSGRQVLKRNLDRLEILTADKGYDAAGFGNGCGPTMSGRSSSIGSSTASIRPTTPGWTTTCTTGGRSARVRSAF